MSDPSDGSGDKPESPPGAPALAGDLASSGRKPTMPSATAEELAGPRTQAAADVASGVLPPTSSVVPESGAAQPQGLAHPPGASAAALSSSTDLQRPGSAPPGSVPPDSTPPSSEAPEQASVLQVLAPHLIEEQEAHRRRDKTIGLVIIGVTFVLCILGSLWGKEMAEPEVSEPPRPPTTEGVVGWPNKVEAIASLPAARDASQREELRGIVAEHVSADGTIDFEMTGAEVRYAFQSAPGRGPQPPREPGTVPRRSYCGKQNVYIRKRGLVAEADMAGYPCSPRLAEPLPDPKCSLKEVWDFAIQKRGAPTKRPARIEYYRAKQGPAYRFSLPGTPHRFSIAADCSRELIGADVFGGVP